MLQDEAFKSPADKQNSLTWTQINQHLHYSSYTILDIFIVALFTMFTEYLSTQQCLVRRSGTGGFGMEGFNSQMSLTGSYWKSSKTFHPWLWRLDRDFLVWLRDLVSVMFSLLSCEISSDWKTKKIARRLWNRRTVVGNSLCVYETYYLRVSVSQSNHTDLDQFSVIWTRLGVHSEVWGFKVKLWY